MGSVRTYAPGEGAKEQFYPLSHSRLHAEPPQEYAAVSLGTSLASFLWNLNRSISCHSGKKRKKRKEKEKEMAFKNTFKIIVRYKKALKQFSMFYFGGDFYVILEIYF